MNLLKSQLKKQGYSPKAALRLIRINEVIQLTGISKSYIYQLVSKKLFPKPIQLIPGGSSVAWVESEIIDWIGGRIEDRNKEVGNNG